MQSMSYEECVTILEAFRPNPLPCPGNEVAIKVCVVEGEIKLVVVALRTKEVPGVGEPFTYKFNGVDKEIMVDVAQGYPVAVDVVPEEPAGEESAGAARAGDFAKGCGGAKGTAGWFFGFGDGLLCLSNWHVFGPEGTAKIGKPVTAEADVEAFLAFSARCDFNDWDLSVARIKNPDHVVAEMAHPGGYGYPRAISDEPWIDDTTTYGTVGYGHQGWSYGTLNGVWTGWLRPSYDETYFRNQLLFKSAAQAPMTEPGDSGSIVIRSSGQATGLVFSRIREDGLWLTLANPLHRLKLIPGRDYGAFPGFWYGEAAAAPFKPEVF